MPSTVPSVISEPTVPFFCRGTAQKVPSELERMASIDDLRASDTLYIRVARAEWRESRKDLTRNPGVTHAFYPCTYVATERDEVVLTALRSTPSFPPGYGPSHASGTTLRRSVKDEFYKLKAA